MVMILIGFASAFGYMMAIMQLPAKLTAFFLTVSDNKYVVLLFINLMLLVLGCLMDLAPLLLICTPILLPVVKSFGIDPVHFGIVMLLNLDFDRCLRYQSSLQVALARPTKQSQSMKNQFFRLPRWLYAPFIYTVIYSILQVLRYQKLFAVAGFQSVVNNTETHPNNPPMSC